MSNHSLQSSLFPSLQINLETQQSNQKVPVRLRETEISSIIHRVFTPPIASLEWRGNLEAVLNGNRTQRLERLLEQIHVFQGVLVVDFNWTNFATLFNHKAWGMIGNLHPRNCLKERNKNIEKLLGQSLIPTQRNLLEAELNPENQELYRLGVRRAMLEKLVEVAQDYDTVVSETLDVGRLHQSFWKQQVIKDLGWFSLLEDFRALLEQQGTKLVLLEREYKSLTCPNCQCSSRENRYRNSFYCVNCGFGGAPDFMAGMNMWADWIRQSR